MSSVQFQNKWRSPQYEPETPKIIQWTMKYSGGLVKDEKQALYVVAGLAVLVIILAGFIFPSGIGTARVDPEEFKANNRPQLPQ